MKFFALFNLCGNCLFSAVFIVRKAQEGFWLGYGIRLNRLTAEENVSVYFLKCES